MDEWSGRRVVITGAAGFLGRHLVEMLLPLGATVVGAGRRPRPTWFPGDANYLSTDLSEIDGAALALHDADDVFHLAAVGYGFAANASRQGQLLTENVLLNTSVMESARRVGVQRYLYTSSAAVYPAGLELLDEAQVWDAAPYPGEAGYGWAKRIGEIQAQLYAHDAGIKVAIVRPSNPYGPYDDLDPSRAHVIPSLIARAAAGERPLHVRGTGAPIRSFVYATDVVRGMVKAMEIATAAQPINVGSPVSTSIADVAKLVAHQFGIPDQDVVFDNEGPEGPARRVVATKRQQELLLLGQLVQLEEGIARTARWVSESGAAMVAS